MSEKNHLKTPNVPMDELVNLSKNVPMDELVNLDNQKLLSIVYSLNEISVNTEIIRDYYIAKGKKEGLFNDEKNDYFNSLVQGEENE